MSACLGPCVVCKTIIVSDDDPNAEVTACMTIGVVRIEAPEIAAPPLCVFHDFAVNSAIHAVRVERCHA